MARTLAVSMLILAALLAPGTLEAQTFVRGDANADGTLNIADTITVLNYVSNGGTPPTILDAADWNDNGVVEVADAVYSLLFLFVSGSPPPPAPFPVAGVDTTPPNFPTTPNGSLEFRITGATSCAGAQLLVSIHVDNTDPIEAMSFRVVCDPSLASFVSDSSDPLTLILGDQPDFYSSIITGSELVIDTLFDFLNPTNGGIQPGVDQRVVDITVSVAGLVPVGTIIPIEFEDDAAAAPAKYNLGSVAGEVVLPILTNGSVTANCMQEEFLRGDANEDGAVSISDAVYMVQYLFLSGPASDCERTGDANGDGFLNVADAVYLLNAYFSGGAAIPAPYPDCDLDPFASALECVSYPITCP